jgi:UDP-2-acetamido-3-amino-2,3-dideoxy-glucuronate N-acetyltransferase
MPELFHLEGTSMEHPAAECAAKWPECPFNPTTREARTFHPLRAPFAAEMVTEPAQWPKSAKVWHPSHLGPRVTIGERTTIGRFCDIGPDVTIGDDCCISSGAKLYGPLIVGDGVFIGPNAVFTNDHFPRAGKKDYERKATVVGDGTSIGANATILPGRIIGQSVMIGAGSVVTHHVPEMEIWEGSPARMVGMVDMADNSHRGLFQLDPYDHYFTIPSCSCGWDKGGKWESRKEAIARWQAHVKECSIAEVLP